MYCVSNNEFIYVSFDLKNQLIPNDIFYYVRWYKGSHDIMK